MGHDSPSSGPKEKKSQNEIFLERREILTLIFELFLPQITPEIHKVVSDAWRKQLLSLALVCRAFCDPALDCLWSHLDSLTPLLKLHPGMQVIGGLYFFLGDIDDPEATVFHRYARVVRTITFNGGKNKTHAISLAGMSWLGQQLKGNALLPGLRRICFKDSKCDSVHLGLLPLILSPSIETVDFTGTFLSGDVFHLYSLPLICKGAPKLKHLSIQDHNAESCTVIWASLPTILGRLHLESLSIIFPCNTTLPPPFAAQLCKNLRSITSLTLDIHTASHGPSVDVSAPIFPALTSLELVNRSQCDVCQCYPQNLVKLATSMTFHISTHLTDVNKFAQTIETLATLQDLKAVKIIPKDRDVIIKPDAVKGFLSSLNLETFEIRDGILRVDDDKSGGGLNVLIDAAYRDKGDDRVKPRVLRSLKTPRRCIDARAKARHYPPISTLVYVARHAQGLRQISLAIYSSLIGPGFDTFKSLMDTWEDPAVPSTLRHLEIADRRSGDRHFKPTEYRDLARLLDTIFPNLDSITMPDDPNREKTWDEHWNLIEEHRQMRKALRLCGMNFW
ncbi:hypothetical protein DFP72DRAFT_152402 [Ephemerocybe angulata]|uniref:F-box domain-containing protein n=1 Tax=Ephemerocybe angulata TaxID=980116 RepID=A0A8H6HBG3_9AGAR|nr:hypothetical protein DFP72DRAFT_152402 [Tulosesus angulatus]